MIDGKEYVEKTYAAWLGKIIGIRLGAPVEGWSAAEIAQTYGKINGYLVDYQTFAADDDSNGPLFFVRALERNCSPNITAQEMGENVLNWLCEEHGFFWWGGEGIATEHTAYNRLKAGIHAPQSGSIATNGLELAEQIGGQIFSDCWGYVAPNDPDLAKNLAAKMSSVTHDGDGIQGGIFVAVSIALAYGMNDAKAIVEKALTYLDANSSYVKVCREIIHQIKNYPNDPQSVLAYIQQYHSYEVYPGACHILPNTAIMIWALYYGNNDFDETMNRLCEAGWDTDCTLGNVGSIMGAMLGLDGIDDKWLRPIQDIVLSSSVLGSENINTISRTARYFCELGFRLKGLELPSIYQSNPHVTDFILPRSCGGMRVNAHRYFEANLKNQAPDLKVILNNAYPDTIGEVYLQTYYHPQDVYDSRYEPSFSPIVYPGEILEMTISNPLNVPAQFRLFAQDEADHQIVSEKVDLSTQQTLSLKIPSGSQIIKKIGVQVLVHQRMMRSYFLIHQLKVIPSFDFTLDFTKLAMNDWGIDFGDNHRVEIDTCVTHHGHSTTSADGLHLDGMITFGDAKGMIDEIEVELVQLQQGNLTIAFDVQGATYFKGIQLNENYINYIENDTIYESKSLKHKINGKIKLKIDRKCGLIMVVNGSDSFTFAHSSSHFSVGACSLMFEGQSCIIKSCRCKNYGKFIS